MPATCVVCGEPYDHVHVAGQSDPPKEEDTLRLDHKIYTATLENDPSHKDVPIELWVNADGSIRGIYTTNPGGSGHIGTTVSIEGTLAESLIDFCIDVAANLPNPEEDV